MIRREASIVSWDTGSVQFISLPTCNSNGLPLSRKITTTKLANYQHLETICCRAWWDPIIPNVKFLCTQEMLCYGGSASAFIDYFQIVETTCWMCVSTLGCGLLVLQLMSFLKVQSHPTTSMKSFHFFSLLENEPLKLFAIHEVNTNTIVDTCTFCSLFGIFQMMCLNNESWFQ